MKKRVTERGPCDCMPEWLALGVRRSAEGSCAACGLALGEDVRKACTYMIPCSDVAHPLRSHMVVYLFHLDCSIDFGGRSDLFMRCPLIVGSIPESELNVMQFMMQTKHKGSKRRIYCSGCQMREQVHRAFKRCSKCHGPYYCSQECQHEHWPVHKTFCK